MLAVSAGDVLVSARLNGLVGSQCGAEHNCDH